MMTKHHNMSTTLLTIWMRLKERVLVMCERRRMRYLQVAPCMVKPTAKDLIRNA